MRRVSLVGVLLACSLVACGGGGGSSTGGGGGQVLPSAPPPVSYSSRLVFVGSLSGIQTAERAIQLAHPMTAGTPIPVMVVSPQESGVSTASFGGYVEAQVSPQPASTPATSFTQTNQDAVLATPSPVPSGATPAPLPSGVIAEANVTGANVVQAQSSGTATASIGAPVNQSPTAPVYSYMSIALDCGSGPGGIAGGLYTAHFGWKYSGGTWVADDSTSDADIYIDGPGCAASNPGESQPTIHVTAGDVRISTDTAFNAVAARQWANDETSFTLSQAIARAPDGSQTALVIGKTRDASHTFKLFPNAIGAGTGFFGAIEVSGASVDGF